MTNQKVFLVPAFVLAMVLLVACDPRSGDADAHDSPGPTGLQSGSMQRIASFFRRIWGWLSRHPDEDPDAPRNAPFSSGRPHGQGGAGG